LQSVIARVPNVLRGTFIKTVSKEDMRKSTTEGEKINKYLWKEKEGEVE
jgi:hypothetical protein